MLTVCVSICPFLLYVRQVSGSTSYAVLEIVSLFSNFYVSHLFDVFFHNWIVLLPDSRQHTYVKSQHCYVWYELDRHNSFECSGKLNSPAWWF